MSDSSNVREVYIMTASKIKEELFDKVAPLSPGTFISYANLEQWTGIPDREKLQRFMRSVNKRLQKEKGHFLKTENGKGYRILPPGEEYSLPLARYKKARFQVGEAIRMVNCIRQERIPEEKKAVTTATINFLTNKWGMMGAFALTEGE